MKKSTSWVMLAAMAIPGAFACSCTGAWVREFRDAALAGTADAVEVAAFNLATGYIPDLNAPAD